MYRVVFVGSIKELTPEYEKYNNDLYDSARTLDGFIGIDSEVVEGIEITISKWKTKKDVMDWAMDPLHMEAKKQVNLWYYWYKSLDQFKIVKSVKFNCDKIKEKKF